MTQTEPVLATRDILVEQHPSNSKNLVCVGCPLDPNRRNVSFAKQKLTRHVDTHRDRGHSVE